MPTWHTSLLVEVEIEDGKFTVNYIPIEKCEEVTALSDNPEILGGFFKRSKEILEDGFVKRNYTEFVMSEPETFEGYLKHFRDADKLRNSVYEMHPEFRGKKIYLYAPTFREKDGNRIEYNPRIDWDALSAELAEDEIFVIRRHPVMKYDLINKEYNNIKDLSQESTLALTAVSDVLITDYSSVIYDACLLDVPTVFYCPDYKEYDRGFYLSFPDDLPGEMITEGKGLAAAIRRAKENPPVDRIEKFRNGQLSACDGHSAERVAALIKSWLK
jgi:CDP-glycerol glycerophosphotransferase (TagB/SpsB family)